MASTENAFHNQRYLRMNARRLEHLAGLALDIEGKDVLEVGAGIGDLTSFFLDRDCRVTSVEPRTENVDALRARYADVDWWPANRIRVVEADAYHLGPHGTVAPHQIVFCFGLLYHLEEPARALQEMAGSCTELLILETAVSTASGDVISYLTEDAADLTNSISGKSCLPSREWVYKRLSELFAFVYMPLTQPLHNKFRLDWRHNDDPPKRQRAVFIASRQELVNPVLYRGMPDLQFHHMPQLGALAQTSAVSVIASMTTVGPMTCFPDDLITNQLVRFGAHTRNEIAMLLRFVDQGDCVFDIGAHIGTFAVPLAAAVGPEGRLVAVEALTSHYDKLVQNLGARGLLKRCHPVRAAVGPAEAALNSQIVQGNSGGTYLIPAMGAEADIPPARSLDGIHAEFGEGRRIDVLKIDVEGMELDVLRTATEILVRDRPILYMEISEQQLGRYGATPEDIDQLLTAYGYCYFRNVGERNSTNDTFRLQAFDRVRAGGPFFDLLAIPGNHPRLHRIGDRIAPAP
jgi:FkbM family methyltransferase